MCGLHGATEFLQMHWQILATYQELVSEDLYVLTILTTVNIKSFFMFDLSSHKPLLIVSSTTSKCIFISIGFNYFEDELYPNHTIEYPRPHIAIYLDANVEDTKENIKRRNDVRMSITSLESLTAECIWGQSIM